MSTLWVCVSHVGTARATMRKEEIKCKKKEG